MNQAYLTVKKNKRIIYCDYFVLDQIVEASTPPQDMSTYTLKGNELKVVRPKYNAETGKFLGLYETVGYSLVRGSSEEVFFNNYGYDKKKLKVLYSHYRRRMLNSFYGTMFNRHKILVERGEIDSDKSDIFLFLPSITDRSEEIHQYLKNVSILPIDIKQNQLNVWTDNSVFDPSKLDLFGHVKKTMSDAVYKCLEHMNKISNSNLIRNVDSLLSRRKVDVPVDWVGEDKARSTPAKFKMSY